MNILVCVKQVPDTVDVKFDPVDGRLIRDGLPCILNPFDSYSLETAVRLKEASGGKLIAVTMGPEQASAVLKDCLSVGADAAYHIKDDAFAGSDTMTTAKILAAAVRKIEAERGETFDVIFCGKQSTEGMTAQVGAALAQKLDCAQITYVSNVTYENEEMVVQRASSDGYELLKCKLPVVITVVKTPYELRYGTILARMAAIRAVIPVFTAEDLGLDAEQCGTKGSLSRMTRIEMPVKEKECIRIQGESPSEMAHELLSMLSDKKVL